MSAPNHYISEEPAGEFRRTLLVPGGVAAGEPRTELKEEGGAGRGTRSIEVN